MGSCYESGSLSSYSRRLQALVSRQSSQIRAVESFRTLNSIIIIMKMNVYVLCLFLVSKNSVFTIFIVRKGKQRKTEVKENYQTGSSYQSH